MPAAHKIIAFVGSDWSDAPTSVKDAANNAWTLLPNSAASTTNGSLWLYALDVPAGDVGIAVALTALFPSSNGQSIVIAEVSGLLAGTPRRCWTAPRVADGHRGHDRLPVVLFGGVG